MLQNSAGKETEATGYSDQPEAGWYARAKPAAFMQSQRQQGNCRDQRSRGQEQERADVVHRRLLEDERQPPDGGNREQHEIGVETAHGREGIKSCEQLPQWNSVLALVHPGILPKRRAMVPTWEAMI